MRTSQSDLILQKCLHSEDLKTQIALEVKENNYRHMPYTFFTLTPLLKDGYYCWKDFVPNCSVVNEAMMPHLNDSKTVVATVSTMFCFMCFMCFMLSKYNVSSLDSVIKSHTVLRDG